MGPDVAFITSEIRAVFSEAPAYGSVQRFGFFRKFAIYVRAVANPTFRIDAARIYGASYHMMSFRTFLLERILANTCKVVVPNSAAASFGAFAVSGSLHHAFFDL